MPYIHGEVRGDIADIMIDEIREVKKKVKSDAESVPESGYELLSEEDVLERIKKKEEESDDEKKR